jgi:hypothetical protein
MVTLTHHFYPAQAFGLNNSLSERCYLAGIELYTAMGYSLLDQATAAVYTSAVTSLITA